MTHPTVNRRQVMLGALALGSTLPALPSLAQPAGWPSRPIKLIVAGTPGAGGDIFARLIATPLQDILKQPVVVDARPGANGMIAGDAVAKAAADGYTLLLAPSSTILLNPVVVEKMPFDPAKDLVPVAQVGAAGILLVANPSTGFKSLKDMVAYAKANPGKLSHGSWARGSSGHLVMEGIKAHFGLDMVHVPYKSMTSLVTDVISGTIPVAFTDIASPIPHVRAGKLAALGTSGSQRWPATQDIPRLSEQGYKFDADGWYAVFAPAGTPQAIVDRLNHEIYKIQASSEVRPKIEAKNMIVPPTLNAAQFADSVREDGKLWQALAISAGLKNK
jgi:tripartite-type tricarboxylate transporter receptor subunit TctC